MQDHSLHEKSRFFATVREPTAQPETTNSNVPAQRVMALVLFAITVSAPPSLLRGTVATLPVTYAKWKLQ
jgi:hypothetical protein